MLKGLMNKIKGGKKGKGGIGSLSDDTTITNFMDRINSSNELMKTYRQGRKQYIDAYSANMFNKSGSKIATPLNLIEVAVNVYLQRLISSNPKITITPNVLDANIKLSAKTLERASNGYLPKMNFAEELETVAKDAMFGMGIMKVGRDQDGVYSEHISLDDWVHDLSATSWNKVQFMGNRYRVDAADLIEYYELSPSDAQTVRNATSDNLSGESRVSDITGDRDIETGQVSVWDIYLPKTNEIVVLLDNDNDFGDVILDRYKWEGTPTGPFFRLMFNLVPDNTIPLAPAALWMDIHNLVNDLLDKLTDQSTRQKNILGVTTGSEADGAKIRDARDGAILSLSNPDQSKEFKVGGIDQSTFGFAMAMKDQYSWMAGNLDALGGLGPQSKTLGQDELLSATASQRVRQMQERMIVFTSQVCGAIVDQIYHDTELSLDVAWTVDGMEDVVYYEKLTPAQRCYDFRSYNISVNPSSLHQRTPEEKLSLLTQFLTQIFMPMMPVMAEQGVVLNFEALSRLMADYSNLPELNTILEYTQPREQSEQKMTGSAMAKSPVTTRNYVRENRSAVTQGQKEQNHVQMAFGKGVQDNEKQ